jgi:glycyl-tRNA synthetase beta chain
MSQTPAIKPLLIELQTEELPPKALQALGRAFAEGLRKVLAQNQLLVEDNEVKAYATPRRLAASFSKVLGQAQEQAYTEKLMPAKIGLSDSGEMSPALIKKLAGKGLQHLTAAELIRESDGKQDYLYAKGVAPGASLSAALQDALDQALANLPIPKVMRYQLADGVTSVRFVRPAHHLVALWGQDIVDVNALGLTAGRTTVGHRFLAKKALTVTDVATYADTLLDDGKVIASFTTRRENIAQQLHVQAESLGATIGDDAAVTALLDEVTALVEFPVVYIGQFDQQFLQVPPECLILTMRLNQKYFPLFDPQSGKLTHRFLIVSNMQVENPDTIISGNEKVVRPRLADAQFFFDTDRKMPLADRVDELGVSVYHNKLGSQRERVERMRAVARHVAMQIGSNVDHADRAALLAKADLNTSMVGEFPELQGIIGAYYAEHDGEPADVVLALKRQYQLRVDSPVAADTITATVLFMAERLETLVGIWGIGLAPTGERDPYALRRAALGLISAYEQLLAGGYLAVRDGSKLALSELLSYTATLFPAGVLDAQTTDQVRAFIYERYRNQLANQFERPVIDAVLSLEPAVHQVLARVQACDDFAKRAESASLASANKRISNLLKKAEEQPGLVDQDKLIEPAEKTLAQVLATLKPVALSQFEQGDFATSLATMAQSRDAVDAFFNDVMVMDEDLAVRRNRLALLNELHHGMNQVADIAKLVQ